MGKTLSRILHFLRNVCKLGAPAECWIWKPSPHCNCGPPTSRMSYGDELPLFALYYIAIARCKLPTTIVTFFLRTSETDPLGSSTV